MSQPRLLGGRYELDGLIGRGGMAEVYHARDLRLDRSVAVKMLRQDLARDHTFQTRFRREAQSAASLNHPSIIAVYDTGEDTLDEVDIPFIVMEHVEGRTLKELLDDDRRLLPERCAEIIDGVLRALEYSHRNGIVHRDIKPANVMLTQQAEAKVMDFGIARATDDNQATMTQTSQVIGTAQYLSPEQARGERVDARSDIYSTGCVLYELLTGHPPFSGDSPVSIAYQHVREDPVPPGEEDPEIPEWLDEVVLRSMTKDRDQRYQSADEMREDIQRGLQGMQTAASTMAVPAAAGETSTLPPADGGDEGPPRRDRGGRRGFHAVLWVILALAVLGALVFAGWMLNQDPPQGTEVPDVVGMAEDRAEDSLRDEGFSDIESQSENHDDVDEGDVIRTDPEGGEEVQESETITLVVSEGPGEAQVPDVQGMSRDEAVRELQEQGFQIGSSSREPSDSVAEGNVVRTDPEGGSSADPGTRVDLWMSDGPEQVSVPDLSEMTREEAESELSDAGLSADFQEEENGDVEPDRVLGQDPEPGSEVDPGSTVTVRVATQPDENTQSPTDQPPESPTDDGGNGDDSGFDPTDPFPDNGNGNGNGEERNRVFP
ncbi:serine/threonine-protein kinase [Haloactinospora alba]|uniref:non-specific serine/threonine protein kinase n=1 Tax=Haloactinospora alba TaxID=405555 RepID=A0A543N9W8_9ACTN|nr:Stk1 family PASTA domain-containing Ser/Thr kinase [Haloactinospora alba]TQN28636.1 serine/threonine-protein kinase [Haloactinospora alba]